MFDLIGMTLTYNRASVLANTQRLGTTVDCSMHSEAVGANKCSNVIITGRDVLTALGVPPNGPTFLGYDNKAGMLVANNAGSSTRSRHFLCMYTILQQRGKREQIAIRHVSNVENAADFLTKWVDKSRFKRSSIYLTNERNAPG
uniref:Uncharacterized protein n=1 Tax=Coccolithus braarudii TaxID=221442 RepID=A0A7S0LAY4_9EUKA|mmetsp:Transcript_24862/g.53644  ORF Transcript_24862/g.53644 Transcript_24862/m.53644 type:complete len:144 (+) Transcript_24862:1434-1865(+)